MCVCVFERERERGGRKTGQGKPRTRAHWRGADIILLRILQSGGTCVWVCEQSLSHLVATVLVLKSARRRPQLHLNERGSCSLYSYVLKARAHPGCVREKEVHVFKWTGAQHTIRFQRTGRTGSATSRNTDIGCNLCGFTYASHAHSGVCCRW